MKKIVSIALCLALIMLSFSSVLAASDKITVKMGTVLAETHPLQQLTYYFQNRVDELIPGRIEWKNYINSALGGERDIGESILSGVLEGGVIACSTATSFAPMQSVVLQDVPFLFKDVDTVYAAIDEWYRELMDEDYAKYDLTNMAYMIIGGQEVENSVRPIRTPADLKDLKIRVYASIGTYNFIESCGGLPVSMDFGEVYTSIQQGTIDGVFTSSYAFVPQKFVEVDKYHTKLGVTHCAQTILFSKSWFETLPEDVQAAFIQAGRETEEYCRYTFGPANDIADYENITKAGVEVYYPTEDEYNMFAEATKNYCYDNLRGEVGEELWDKAIDWLAARE